MLLIKKKRGNPSERDMLMIKKKTGNPSERGMRLIPKERKGMKEKDMLLIPKGRKGMKEKDMLLILKLSLRRKNVRKKHMPRRKLGKLQKKTLIMSCRKQEHLYLNFQYLLVLFVTA